MVVKISKATVVQTLLDYDKHVTVAYIISLVFKKYTYSAKDIPAKY